MDLLPGRIGHVDGRRSEVDIDQGRVIASEFPTAPNPGNAITVASGLVPAEPGTGVLAGEVQLAEHLGGETYVYVALDRGRTVTVEIKGQAAVEPGARLDLAIEGNRFHVFGPDEKVLRHA